MTMAENQGNTAVPQHGDRDRVAMLSLKADGTPDQHNPEIVGEREFALAATKEQFKQQAVSAVDQEKRAELFGTGAGVEQLEQDPKIAELQSAHADAEKAAESAAESTVGALFVEDDTSDAKTAPVKAPATVKPRTDSTK
jgi:hypothetical protein